MFTRRAFVAGSKPEGGVINLFNRREVPVFAAGYGQSGLGGAMIVRNERGTAIVHAAADDENSGLVTIYNKDGERARTVKPLP